ncbi:MAG: aldehyde dehydrogenase family protein [Balneolales bacterium]
MPAILDKITEIHNFINGQFVSGSNHRLDVISPLDGNLISTVALSTESDLENAVQAAGNAFPGWSGRTAKERVQVLYKYRELLEKHRDELVELCHIENGKTLGESKAEGDGETRDTRSVQVWIRYKMESLVCEI